MKLLPIFLASIPLIAFGGESYFFTSTVGGKQVKKTIEGEQLQIIIPIKRIDPPKASSIFLYRQGLGPGREYKIQIDLTTTPGVDWRVPMLKLDDDIITGSEFILARALKNGDSSTLNLECDDLGKIRRWCQLLGPLLKIPGDQILDTTKAEQAGADQPATKPADKPSVQDQPSTPTPKDGPR